MVNSKHLTKREKRFDKYKLKFENGTLSRAELEKLSCNKINEYLLKEMKKKYNINNITCCTCAKNTLYNEGYVSDDELAKIRYKK